MDKTTDRVAMLRGGQKAPASRTNSLLTPGGGLSLQLPENLTRSASSINNMPSTAPSTRYESSKSGQLPPLPSKLRAGSGARKALALFCFFLVAFGVGILICAQLLESSRQKITRSDKQPPHLWHMGVLPVVTGMAGIVVICIRWKSLIFSWVLLSTFLSLASYAYFSLGGYMQPASYSVSVYLFYACDIVNSTMCICSRQLTPTPMTAEECEGGKQVTTLYMVLMLMFVLNLTTMVICCVTGCVTTLCLQDSNKDTLGNQIRRSIRMKTSTRMTSSPRPSKPNGPTPSQSFCGQASLMTLTKIPDASGAVSEKSVTV